MHGVVEASSFAIAMGNPKAAATLLAYEQGQGKGILQSRGPTGIVGQVKL